MNNLRRRMMMGLASLPPKEETTEIVAPAKGFFERNAANGNQFTCPIIRGGVKEIRGNTLAWNQLLNGISSSAVTISGHKYYKKIESSSTVITSAGETISAMAANDMVVDLTLMFGAGNEPTVEEFEAMFPLDYYAQDAGRLINFNGEELVSKDINNNTIGRIVLNPTTWTGKLNGEGESVTVFPDGLRGAGEAYDSIEKVDGQWYGVVNIGNINLGSLTYEKAATKKYFSVATSFIKNPRHSTVLANLCCTKYTTETWSDIYSNSKNGIAKIGQDNELLAIYDDAYTEVTASAFKTAMDGVMLNYELATPQRYLLDPVYQAYLNALYQVEQGGMEYILPSNTSTPYTSPAKIDVKYNSINDRKRSGLPNVVSEPKVYDAEIEYLESSGTQYIDTKITGNAKIIGQVQAIEVKNAAAIIIGSDPINGAAGTWFGEVGTIKKWGIGSSSGQYANIEVTTKIIFDLTFNDNGCNGTVNEQEIARTVLCTQSTWIIFAGNAGGYKIKGRVYFMQFYKANILVADFIPVRIGTTGYLYDKVSGKLFGNAGTDNFILGPDKQ